MKSKGHDNLEPRRWSGNPSGRPKGAKHKTSEIFRKDLLEFWEKNGKEVIAMAAAENPMDFCKMVVSLMPKEEDDKPAETNNTVTIQVLNNWLEGFAGVPAQGDNALLVQERPVLSS